jgi:hypothetical protein
MCAAFKFTSYIYKMAQEIEKNDVTIWIDVLFEINNSYECSVMPGYTFQIQIQ